MCVFSLGHRLSKESSSKIQLQLVLQDGGTINFHFTGSNPIVDRKSVSESLQRSMPKALPQVLYLIFSAFDIRFRFLVE